MTLESTPQSDMKTAAKTTFRLLDTKTLTKDMQTTLPDNQTMPATSQRDKKTQTKYMQTDLQVSPTLAANRRTSGSVVSSRPRAMEIAAAPAAAKAVPEAAASFLLALCLLPSSFWTAASSLRLGLASSKS
jgi:hypothetical protein